MLDNFVSFQVSHCCPLGWLHIILDVSLLLTEVAFCNFKCHIFVHLGYSTWLELSHCCSLWWLCLIPCVPLPLTRVALITQCIPLFFTGMALCLPVVSLLLTGINLYCPMCPTAAHYSGSASLHVSSCHSMWWVCMVPGLTLTLN